MVLCGAAVVDAELLWSGDGLVVGGAVLPGFRAGALLLYSELLAYVGGPGGARGYRPIRKSPSEIEVDRGTRGPPPAKVLNN